MTLPSDTVVGQYLQLAAIYIGIAVAFTYTCGYQLGQFVHQLNDQLVTFHKLTNIQRITIIREAITNALQS